MDSIVYDLHSSLQSAIENYPALYLLSQEHLKHVASPTEIENFNLDSRQLARIEAVHRGFLYQHLYAVACLFQAAAAGVIVVENDEDVELVFPDKRTYAQVKTRSSQLIFSDIDGALSRFDAIRAEHAESHRRGTAEFVIISNSARVPS